VKPGGLNQEKWFVTWARVLSWVFGGICCLYLLAFLASGIGGAGYFILHGGMPREGVIGWTALYLTGMIFVFLLWGFPALVLASFARSQTLKQEYSRPPRPPRTSGPFSVMPPAPKPGCWTVERGTRF
jgi:hypothetical protein